MTLTPMQIERARAARPSAPNMAPLYAALAKSQAAFKNVVKGKTGHGFKYADIGDVLEMALPILSRNGIAVLQPFTPTEMTTILTHESGAVLEFRTPIIADATGRMNASQKVGASVTYFRRYHLCSVLGIATEDEMDARLRDSRSPNEQFETPDGVMGVKGQAPLSANATPAERARTACDAIMAQMQEAKTQKGLDGVWKRNNGIIERFAASYPVEHGDVLAAYEARSNALSEADAA